MFKYIFDKLSIASKEAVIDGNHANIDDFKDYLHVDREVDALLENIVLTSIQSNKPRLILVSGNVGDGKSHLLAKLFKKFPQEMSSVTVRNDATESNSIARTWVQELQLFLTDFNDDNIGSTKGKVAIVAVNLGILSRFLNETKNFKKLEQFVNTKGILDNLAYENFYHEDSFFQFINLADFKLFTLSKSGAESEFMKNILGKITSKDPENPFRIAMREYYQNHPYQNDCIMRYNFKQLENEEFQVGLIKTLIYIIVKFKLIISVRDLLDFIKDLIVPYAYQQLSEQEIRSKKDYHKYSFQVENSIYSKLFNSQGRSAIFTALAKIDPVKLRSKVLDEDIFKLNAASDQEGFLKEKGLVFSGNFEQIQTMEQRRALVKTFVRAFYLNQIDKFKDNLKTFEKYCHYLFAYHTSSERDLVPLYKEVIMAIQHWNGQADSDHINLPIGQHQLVYKISQQLTLSAEVDTLTGKKVDNRLLEFNTSFPLTIKVSQEEKKFTIDFNLYLLISKVITGYCPTQSDREDHVDFHKFVETVTLAASKNSNQMYFEEINGNYHEKFELKKDWSGYQFIKK